MTTKSKAAKVPGIETAKVPGVSRETMDQVEEKLKQLNVDQVRKWMEGDLMRCISLLDTILTNPALMDEMADVIYARFKQHEAAKAKEGII